MSEYLSSGGWPQRLSPNDNPGDWSPWIIWVALAWTFYLALNVLVIRFRQPPVDDREIERELRRITRHVCTRERPAPLRRRRRPILWGAAHLLPVRAVADGSGAISIDKR